MVVAVEVGVVEMVAVVVAVETEVEDLFSGSASPATAEGAAAAAARSGRSRTPSTAAAGASAARGRTTRRRRQTRGTLGRGSSRSTLLPGKVAGSEKGAREVLLLLLRRGPGRAGGRRSGLVGAGGDFSFFCSFCSYPFFFRFVLFFFSLEKKK